MNFELLRIWSATGEKKTILFVTHSIAEAVFLADRVLVMCARPGRVDEISSSILGRPRTLEMRGSADFGAQVIGIYERLHAGRGAAYVD
jgi:NitT/TauT family transport system ATP-binding protein